MQRLCEMSELAERLPVEPTLILHSACAEPLNLAAQLAENAAAFDGAKVYSLMPMGEAPYGDVQPTQHLSVTTFFPGKGLRSSVSAGRSRTLRHPLSAIPGLFDRREIKADVVFLQVSPPDRYGQVSLGLAVDYLPAVLRQQPLIVAEINPHMPRTCGDTRFDASRIDYFIDATFSPQSVAASIGDDIDRHIAAHVARLVEDGAVLQVGIGSLPDLVLDQLGDRRHLGVHTGIVTNALQILIESGAIDNSTKEIFRGVSVTTMAAGTPAFYKFLNENPLVEFHPCSLTHNADVLNKITGLTAINSVLQIDLSGRANAEAVAGRVVAAPGGLPDFARGAKRAHRGCSILAVRSSFGDQSNILPVLPDGTPITLEASDIDYVVTEHGVATLRGRSAIQRAEALIEVAAPTHRAMLLDFLSAGGVMHGQ